MATNKSEIQLTNELTFLRELEQLTQKEMRSYQGMYGLDGLVNIKTAINTRIIALLEANQLPCNEQGGGSSGIDTADDFAMHCGYSDGHAGPHSYEERTDPFRYCITMPDGSCASDDLRCPHQPLPREFERS